MVELLVVIGIIAVLISILLPTIASARRQSKVIQCLSQERELVRACLMFSQDHRSRLPLAGKLYVRSTSLTDVNALPNGLGDSDRSIYTYAPEGAGAGNPWFLIPWNAAISSYFTHTFTYKDVNGVQRRSSVIPTEDWDYVEDAINSPSGPWRNFMCVEADTIDAGATATGGFNPTPAVQVTVLDVYLGPTASSPAYIWSSDTDYAINEGLLGWDDAHTTYRRLKGRFGGFHDPSSLILLTDGQRRQSASGVGVPPDTNYFGFNDPWNVWTPNASATNQLTQAIPLSGALATPATVDSPLNFATKRHRNKINIAFVDGHAETRVINAKDLSNVYLLPRP